MLFARFTSLLVGSPGNPSSSDVSMLKNFLTEEAEEARNIAGRRPALFAADEDDEVKKFEARRLRRRAQRPDKAPPVKACCFCFPPVQKQTWRAGILMLKKQDSGETSHLFVCFLRSFVVLACSVCLFFVVLFVRLFNFLPKVKHNACFEQRIGLSDGSVLFDEQKNLEISSS